MKYSLLILSFISFSTHAQSTQSTDGWQGYLRVNTNRYIALSRDLMSYDTLVRPLRAGIERMREHDSYEVCRGLTSRNNFKNARACFSIAQILQNTQADYNQRVTGLTSQVNTAYREINEAIRELDYGAHTDFENALLELSEYNSTTMLELGQIINRAVESARNCPRNASRIDRRRRRVPVARREFDCFVNRVVEGIDEYERQLEMKNRELEQYISYLVLTDRP